MNREGGRGGEEAQWDGLKLRLLTDVWQRGEPRCLLLCVYRLLGTCICWCTCTVSLNLSTSCLWSICEYIFPFVCVRGVGDVQVQCQRCLCGSETRRPTASPTRSGGRCGLRRASCSNLKASRSLHGSINPRLLYCTYPAGQPSKCSQLYFKGMK